MTIYDLVRSASLGFSVATIAVFSGSTVVSEPFDIFKDCDVCPEMIELPLGEFMMCAPEGESRRNFGFLNGKWQRLPPDQPYIAYHEGPVHRVEIDISIAMGRNEITHDEWMACVSDGGCNGYIPNAIALVKNRVGEIEEVETKGRHPVMRISFLDAISYARWLNQKIGADVYRLPTEAEWEYAARAGTQTPFAQGEFVTPDQVNYNGKATAENLGHTPTEYVTRWMSVPVDQLDSANELGVKAYVR